ncbi:MAG: LysR family transcriptional regulator [Eubacteriales bacterium]
MDKNLHAVITARLFTASKCFGPGIAELLQKVEEFHSLRKAAASMGMAYSKAWTLVKTCEEHLGEKLLDYTTGGKNGGGARVTDFGTALLTAYSAYCADLDTFQKEAFSKHFSHIITDKE